MKQALAVGLAVAFIFVGLQLGQHLLAQFAAAPPSPTPGIS